MKINNINDNPFSCITRKTAFDKSKRMQSDKDENNYSNRCDNACNSNGKYDEQGIW